MHYLLNTTITLSEALTSFEARTEALIRLSAFDTDWWDWLAIGGRGSGRLSLATWAKSAYASICQRGVERLHAIPPRLIKDMAWAEAAFAADMPEQYRQVGLTYWRNPYKLLGYEDDAVIVNQQLYDLYLAEFEGQHLALMEGLNKYDPSKPIHIDLDQEPCGRNFIGHKWLVTIDAHF